MNKQDWFWKGRDVITTRGMPGQAFGQVIERAGEIDRSGLKVGKPLEGKVLATMFLEPSTRTQFSFQTAMLRLGGSYIGFSSAKGTSLEKGESLHDTVKLVDACADVIVIRHPEEGSAAYAAEVAANPVINGGDGPNQHPTQTMVDLYTIMKEKGKIDGQTILLVGDLKYSRTVHSLALALSNYDVTLLLNSAPTLRMPSHITNEVRNKITVKEVDGPIPFEDADVLYTTRVQRERFADPEEYKKYEYQVKSSDMARMKDDSVLMEPMPRVGQIHESVDTDSRAAYFRQEANGVPVRMALLELLLG